MESQLQLVESKQFGNITCDVWQGDLNKKQSFFMTREQIGQALEYTEPNKAIGKIHERNTDRLDQFSTIVSLTNVEGYRKVARDNIVYTLKGVMEICRFSRQHKADEFMDFVWNIMEGLYTGELQLSNQGYSLAPEVFQSQMGKLFVENSELRQAIIDMRTETQSQIGNLTSMIRRMLPAPHYTDFKNSINPKIDALAKYLNMEHMKVLSSLYKQMSVDHNIDLNQYKSDYVIDNGLQNCSMLDVIDASDELQGMMNSTIDTLLKMYDLKVKVKSEKSIFETNPIKLAIIPLIQKYQDKSKGGTVTYRKVYAHMGVDWHRRQARFQNKNKLKCLPSKTKLLLNDELLMHKFKNSIKEMIAE